MRDWLASGHVSRTKAEATRGVDVDSIEGSNKTKSSTSWSCPKEKRKGEQCPRLMVTKNVQAQSFTQSGTCDSRVGMSSWCRSRFVHDEATHDSTTGRCLALSSTHTHTLRQRHTERQRGNDSTYTVQCTTTSTSTFQYFPQFYRESPLLVTDMCKNEMSKCIVGGIIVPF